MDLEVSVLTTSLMANIFSMIRDGVITCIFVFGTYLVIKIGISNIIAIFAALTSFGRRG